MIVLDPCPFDQAPAAIEVDDEELAIVRAFCTKCFACGPYVALEGHLETAKHKAAKLWNARACTPNGVGLVRRLKDLIARSTDADDAVMKALKEATARIERQELEIQKLRGDGHG